MTNSITATSWMIKDLSFIVVQTKKPKALPGLATVAFLFNASHINFLYVFAAQRFFKVHKPDIRPPKVVLH